MTQLVYSDPTYIDSLACSSTVPLSSTALHLLNATIDEIVQVTVHAIVLSFALPVTVDGFKSTFQRVVGLRLGKECLLEAELAVRDLLKRSGNSKDPALLPSKGESTVVEERTRERTSEQVFSSLREWVMQISGLGALCPSTGPANLTTHLSELVAHRTPPAPSSPHVSFVLTLYVERTLTSLALYLLESISLVVSRTTTSSSPGRIATAQDLEVAFKEDEQIWNWVREMKVRAVIESEAASLDRITGRVKSPTFGGGDSSGDQSALTIAQQQALVGQARKSSASRNGAGNGGAGGPNSFYGLGIRRGSVDSTKSSLVNGQGGGSTASSATSNGGGQHRRRASLALSVVQSFGSNLSNDDPFDLLLNSGQTRKLSMTPDRLRMIEVERARKASELNLRQKASRARGGDGGTTEVRRPPVLESNSIRTTESMSAIPEATRGLGRKKLQARGPHQKDVFDEEAEDDAADEDLFDDNDGTPQKKQPTTTQSLMDLLNSPPPWSGATPGGIPMEMQGSRDTTSSSGMTRESSSQASGGEEAWVNVSPQKRQKGLKAKDEKRDVASERQINNDLVSFFRDSPPTSVIGLPSTDKGRVPSAAYPSTVPSSPPLAGKKSKGGLRGFLDKVTGNARKSSSEYSPASNPMNPFDSLPQDETILSSPTSTGTRPRMRSVSAQSKFSFGGTSQSTATTYALPPGLGGTPEKEKRKTLRERQRSESLSAELRANRGEHLELKSSRPRSPPPLDAPLHQTSQPPVSILKTNSKRSSYSGGGPESVEVALAPPVPLVPPTSNSSNSSSTAPTIVRPRRSSSLKRKAGRARDPSSASTSAVSPPPEPPSIASEPVTLVPTGLPLARSDSRGSNVDPNRGSPERSPIPSSSEVGNSDKESTQHDGYDSGAPRPLPPSTTMSSPSSPVKLRQLLLVDSTSVSSNRRSSAGNLSTGGRGGGGDRSTSPCESITSNSSAVAPTRTTPSSSRSARSTSGCNDGQQWVAPGRVEGQSSIEDFLRRLRLEMDDKCSDKARCLDLIDSWIEKRAWAASGELEETAGDEVDGGEGTQS